MLIVGTTHTDFLRSTSPLAEAILLDHRLSPRSLIYVAGSEAKKRRRSSGSDTRTLLGSTPCWQTQIISRADRGRAMIRFGYHACRAVVAGFCGSLRPPKLLDASQKPSQCIPIRMAWRLRSQRAPAHVDSDLCGVIINRSRPASDEHDDMNPTSHSGESSIEAARDKIGRHLFETAIVISVSAPAEAHGNAMQTLRELAGTFGAFSAGFDLWCTVLIFRPVSSQRCHFVATANSTAVQAFDIRCAPSARHGPGASAGATTWPVLLTTSDTVCERETAFGTLEHGESWRVSEPMHTRR